MTNRYYFRMLNISKLFPLLIAFILVFNLINMASANKPLIHYINPVSALSTRAVDGDTIIVNIAGVKERVRLIGVDTPETKHPRKPVQPFGKEAANFTWRIEEGKKVRLEFEQNQRVEATDGLYQRADM